MSYYVRKINKSKWEEKASFGNENGINKLNADFLGSCLRTIDGEISLWKIDDEQEIDDVVVAIASQGDRPDKMDLLLIDETDLSDAGVMATNAPEGATKICSQHYKIDKINYKKAGEIATIMLNILKKEDGDRCRRIASPDVEKLLITARQQGELSFLPPKSKMATYLDEKISTISS